MNGNADLPTRPRLRRSRHEIATRARRRQKTRNVVQGVLLLTAMAALAGGLAWLLFGPRALPWVLAAALLVALFRPRIKSSWLLSLYGAQPLSRGSAPGLHHIVEELGDRAGLGSTPGLYYVPTALPNAFAVGRGADAALAVTDGLLRLLDRRQLTGVLAHEVSHIRNGDTTIMSLADLIGRLVRALATLAMWSLLLTLPLTLTAGPLPVLVSTLIIALPTLLSLMQLSLSRSREYDADLDAAFLTGDPEGLAQALLALQSVAGRVWKRRLGPASERRDPVVLRSHPATGDRVQRLRELPLLHKEPQMWAHHRPR